MKCAILFAFAAFAFLAQAESKAMTIGFPNMLDRGPVADFLKKKLMEAKDKLDSMLSQAQDTIKEKIEEVKNTAEDLIEKLKQQADKISNKVFEAAKNILDKIDTSVAESMMKSHNVEEISECTMMKDNFRNAVLAVIANTTSCITDKIEEAESYITKIHNSSAEAFNTIHELQTQGIQCIKDIDEIDKIIGPTVCVAGASAKAAIEVGKNVPIVVVNISNLVKEIVTLETDLAICMPSHAMQTIFQQVEPVIVGIKHCIQEKIEGSKASREGSDKEFDNEVR